MLVLRGNRPDSAPGRLGNMRWRRTAVVALAAATVLVLASCSSSRTSSAADKSTGEVTRSAASPSQPPAPTVTPAPEASATPAAAAKFEGAVNYDRFTKDWDAADRNGRLAICAEFFAANPPKTDVIPDANNTGPQIIERYGAMLDVLSALNSDRSNPANNTVADKLAECLTTVHNPDGGSRTQLTTMLDYQAHSEFVGLALQKIDNNSVTRYSNGTYLATDYLGRTYDAKVVEGYAINKLGKTLLQQAFEWDGTASLPGYRLVVSVPGDQPAKYGNVPPVVVDKSRADAPWRG